MKIKAPFNGKFHLQMQSHQFTNSQEWNDFGATYDAVSILWIDLKKPNTCI